MIDAALIQQCADPGLKVEIVQQFIEQAGGPDHLAVSVSQGSRVILVPKPKTENEAMKLMRDYLGQAVVRVGVTQYPAGLGIKDKSELSPDLLDPCKNIAQGTALFAKVYRIVTQWYGASPPEALEDAILAYRSGWFEGRQIFHEPDPGAVTLATPKAAAGTQAKTEHEDDAPALVDGAAQPAALLEIDPNKADIGIDLSPIETFNKEK